MFDTYREVKFLGEGTFGKVHEHVGVVTHPLENGHSFVCEGSYDGLLHRHSPRNDSNVGVSGFEFDLSEQLCLAIRRR